MPDPENTGVSSFLRAHVEPGMVVLDIGAHTGTITALVADLAGAAGRVVAYEPCPDTAATLETRFRDMPQVTVRCAAVSDRPGLVDLHLDAISSKRHTLYASAVSVRGATITVRAVCLDDEMAHLPRVDVIKIDAQGAEARILAGGRRLFRRDHPLLLFELWPAGMAAAGTSPAALFDELDALGYRSVRLSVKGRQKSPAAVRAFLEGSHSPWKAINIVAWPPRWPRRSLARTLRAWLLHVRLNAAMR